MITAKCHSIQRWYKLHGYPSNYRTDRRPTIDVVQFEEEHQPDSISNDNMSFIPSQYQQLNFLEKNIKKIIYRLVITMLDKIKMEVNQQMLQVNFTLFRHLILVGLLIMMQMTTYSMIDPYSHMKRKYKVVLTSLQYLTVVKIRCPTVVYWH